MTAMERQKKQYEKAQKAQRRAEANALVRAELEAQWEKIKADHEKALEEWKVECARLKAEGAQVKDLPKKPKRALKHKPTIQAAAVSPEGEEELESLSSSDKEST